MTYVPPRIVIITSNSKFLNLNLGNEINVMPSSCCVAKCNKIKGRDDSSVRDFLIFHNFPLKTKNKALIEKWTLRVGRPQGDVNSKSMHVCSDHFCEEDFVPETLTKYRLTVEPWDFWHCND